MQMRISQKYLLVYNYSFYIRSKVIFLVKNKWLPYALKYIRTHGYISYNYVSKFFIVKNQCQNFQGQITLFIILVVPTILTEL